MPRERIIHEQMYRQKRIDAGNETSPGLYEHTLIEPGEMFTLDDDERMRFSPALEVAWNRDGNNGIEGWVQVIAHVDAGDVVDRAAQLGGSPDTVSFPSETMNRRQINHMIRTLRRARDAAFGTDE